jgi:hypothetical protein
MKRLLMITSAIGLCLAAPAFAQTTEPDQTNRPRATQPSSSAPAAQSQERQRPNQERSNQGNQAQQQSAPSSSSSSAQAPSDQNKQAQQPASGSSSSSAQAPSNQNQTGQAQRSGSSTPSAQAPSDQKKNGQAQNQRQPDGKTNNAQAPADQQQRTATDRNQPARSGQAQTRQSQQKQDTKTSRDRSSASLNVNINETQRTKISAAFSSINARPVKVNFKVAVGVAVPRTVVLHTVPSTIVEIAPQFRGYSYFATGDEIVIVEPRRKTVVAVLPAGGTARAQAPASNRTSFSEEQREVIRKRASTLRSTATTGSASRIVVEEEVPATIELQEFPAEIVTEVPTVREYRYFRQDNDVVVVDPGRRRVIEVIR